MTAAPNSPAPPPPVRRALRKERPAPEVRRVARRDVEGTQLGTVELDPEVFGLEPNMAVLHQVVTGTQSTRTRAEVRGGGAKPFRQKGTGRARQGSTRAPNWSGGGVALGPKPRSYRQRTPKKMIRLALYSALSDRAAAEQVVLVDRWSWEVPRTKGAVAALEALGLRGRVLVVLGEGDLVAERSFANLPDVQTISSGDLAAYDVLRNEWIVFTDETLPSGHDRGSDSAGSAAVVGDGADPEVADQATAPTNAAGTDSAADETDSDETDSDESDSVAFDSEEDVDGATGESDA
jgi:large subunit ribosomal protein L4